MESTIQQGFDHFGILLHHSNLLAISNLSFAFYPSSDTCDPDVNVSSPQYLRRLQTTCSLTSPASSQLTKVPLNEISAPILSPARILAGASGGIK